MGDMGTVHARGDGHTGVGPAITVRVATTRDALDEHAEAWDRLTTASTEKLPMLSHAWVSSFLEHMVPAGTPWWCFFAYDGPELVGVMPLMRARKWFLDRLRGTADGGHTDFAHPLLDARLAQPALDALVGAAAELAPRLRIRWYRVRDGSPVLACLSTLERRMRVLRPISTWGSLVRTTGDWSEFEAGLGRNFARNLRKGGNRAEREHAVSFRFVGGAEAQSPALLQQFLEVESSGWKGAAGTAIQRSPQLVAFYETLTRRLAHRGWLEWQTLHIDERPVAAHLAVRLGDTVVLPKIGYDEEHARLGPGNLLFRELLVRSFDDPTVNEVNCLSDMPWHRNWGMRSVGYAGVMVGPRGPRATAASLVEMSKPLARDYGRRHPDVQRKLHETAERLRQATRAR
ncbi:GNAT family N-acetyltransferase [Nocardioides sp. HDW12B]|uniref:GNAT family N-acetyltransferase n=1 Tax=Nocardioides sp. HDW12B TaxID=2714939 RepID=UPI00140A7F3A|nr:GNAT family N-acetyltransferase [Nocardioides sp. HDW12B]QIK65257.1 GNAT family N-acetyltransferase [Nocardioides sp. HDW12B]